MKTTRSIATLAGQRIKTLRKTHRGGKVTQGDLARRSGISISFLSMIERGQRSAHIDTFARLADELGVEIEELFRKTTKPSKVGDAALQPLAAAVQRLGLNKHDIARLVTVAEALFKA